MKKNKDGKVVASLTEVKNKTGDIFAVVDEYGEIILTSYNKPRYKVVKIDLAESLEFEGNSTPKSSKQKTKKKKSKAKAAKKADKPEQVETEKPIEEPKQEDSQSEETEQKKEINAPEVVVSAKPENTATEDKPKPQAQEEPKATVPKPAGASALGAVANASTAPLTEMLGKTNGTSTPQPEASSTKSVEESKPAVKDTSSESNVLTETVVPHSDKKEETPVKTAAKSEEKVETPVKQEDKPEEKVETPQPEEAQKEVDQSDSTTGGNESEIIAWNSANANEKSFVSEIQKPLQ